MSIGGLVDLQISLAPPAPSIHDPQTTSGQPQLGHLGEQARFAEATMELDDAGESAAQSCAM
jgi:hypothetical protein